MANSTTTQALAVGEVRSIKGEVFAQSADGQLRRLSAGDKIFEGEVIVTANGSSVEFNMFNGPALNIAEQQSVVIDSQVASSAHDATAGAISNLGSTEAAKVIQALNNTGDQQDFNALLEQEAAAAGLSGGDAGGGNGGSFVNLMRVVESVPATTSFAFSTNPFGTAPTLEGQGGIPDYLPIAVADSLVGVTEDTPFSGNLATNDTPSGDGGNAWSIASNPSNGTAVVNTDGTFTYTPNANFNGADSFTYLITDADGSVSTATVSFNVGAVNDLPIAVADVNSGNEDSIDSGNEDSIINGTVATNDSDVDAGAVLSYSLNTPVAGLTLGTNGSYSFNAGNAAYQSLAEGATMNVVANYTVTDEHGASSASTLTITITGTNDVPVITSTAQSGTVTEDGTLTATGTVTSGDIDNDATATYSGNATGTYGSFAVTSAGVWTYTLANGTNGVDGVVQNLAEGETYDETFTVTVTDGLGGTATQDVVITITGTNDVPRFTLVNDGNNADSVVSVFAPNVALTYSTNLADWSFGSDGASVTAPTVTGITGNATVFSSSSSAVVIDLKDSGGAVVGKLTLNADGTDSLQVFARAPTVVESVLNQSLAVAGGPVGSIIVPTTIPGLSVTVTGSDGDTTAGEADDAVNASTAGWGVKNNTIENNESLTFSFDNAVQRFRFDTVGFTGSGSTRTIAIVVTYANGAGTETFNVSVTDGQEIRVQDLIGFGSSSGELSFTSVQVINDGSGAFRLNDIAVSQVTSTAAPDLDYNLTLNVVDKDGDTVSQTFSVHLDGDTTTGGLVVEAITGTSDADALVGTTGADILIGGAGNDTLTGGLGSDTFKWSLGETGADVIKDFNLETVAQGGDVLDLTGLLTGESPNAESLDAYLNFSANDLGQTLITVDANGAADGGMGQTITLENVSYSDLQAYAGVSDMDIITKLLADGNLKTSP